MAEQTFWQRCLSHFTSGPSNSTPEVALPVEKLSCSLQARKAEVYRPTVLVSCGSFNPPTNMHLRLFELARDHLTEAGYDVWAGYMSPVNDDYKKEGLANSADRIAMAQAAVEASDLIMVDAWEASQPGYQRSLHVLRSIKNRLTDAVQLQSSTNPSSNKESVKTMLLCGSDLVESFLKPGVWKPDHIKSILEEHGVVCISRNTPSLMSAWREKEELRPYQDKLIWVEEPVANDISSSKIRELIQKGKSARYLTPDPVLEYIKERNLYCGRSAGVA